MPSNINWKTFYTYNNMNIRSEAKKNINWQTDKVR